MTRKITIALLAATLVIAGSTSANASGVANSGTPSTLTGVPQQVLFRAGTGGYGCFRIPALVRTKAGSLLAFAEGRKAASCGDRGDIDIVMRRSTNDGRTWSPISVIPDGSMADLADGGGQVHPGSPADAPVTHDNPAPVADLLSGRIYLLSSSNPATNSYPRLPWVQASNDDGLTWSAPEQLPLTPLPSPAPPGLPWLATGPGHGIQLTEGSHVGRLVVGAAAAAGSDHYTGYFYLDPPTDPGADPATGWHAAQASDTLTASPQEVAVAESTGGGVYEVARAEGGTQRLNALGSTPAGTAVPMMPAFTTGSIPSFGNIQGSLLRLHAGSTQQYLLAAPAGDRTNMTIWSRCGSAWQQAGKMISGNRAGYSDLAILPSNEIGLLYEGGVDFSAAEIRFLHFTEAQLGFTCGTDTPLQSQNVETNEPAGATTPDASRQANDASFGGNAALAAGTLDGNALSLDGNGDYAQVPYSRALDPGATNFTYSMWFQYNGKKGDPARVLLWAYGLGADKPQVWIRVDPDNDQVIAAVQGTSTNATATLTDPTSAFGFGDGDWHHLTLTRTGSTITIRVGDVTSDPFGGLGGAVSGTPADGALGLRIGARPDATATQSFPGAIDEVRLYRQALTPAQITLLDAPQAVLDPATESSLALRLPFTVIDPAQTVTQTTVHGIDDESGNCADGTILGTRASVDSVKDKQGTTAALMISAGHVTGVHAPMSASLDVGAGDFTFSLKFQFDASADTSPRALLWAYGINPGVPQLWVQALPASNTLRALLVTDTGATTTVNLTGTLAFGDNQWHTLALRRQGASVLLSVDNGLPADPPGTISGSLTANEANGIDGLTIGAKPDGTKILNGAVDEFTAYKRSLSSTELASLAATGLVTAGRTMRWSFDGKYMYDSQLYRPQPATTPATPDVSGRCHNAYLLGGATTTGDALNVGTGYAQVAYGSELSLSGDFTVSVSMTYTATAESPDQVLLWAYGVGPLARQLWLRASPKDDGVYADVETDTGNVRLFAKDTDSTPGFANSGWHQVTLVRSGTALHLYVDGHAMADDTLGGAVVAPDTSTAQTLWLGAKPDGTQLLNGSLDNVRIFAAALDATGVQNLADGTVPTATPPVLDLPFDITAESAYPRM